MAYARLFPSTDAGLLAWSLNFSTKISATPLVYGLSAALATGYATLHTAFATNLAACDPNERSKSLVAAKNDARTNLKTQARLLAKLVEGTATVTDAQKIELGLNVRKQPSPIPVPDAPPMVEVTDRIGTTVYIRLHDGSGRRAKPTGVAGARVYTYIGAAPPATVSEWFEEGQTTRGDVELDFDPETPAGTKVWITAAWYNPRGQLGPGCTPISTVIAGGAMELAA